MSKIFQCLGDLLLISSIGFLVIFMVYILILPFRLTK